MLTLALIGLGLALVGWLFARIEMWKLRWELLELHENLKPDPFAPCLWKRKRRWYRDRYAHLS